MNIIDIYKTEKEDTRLKNHQERDIYTCVYIDENKQKKEFQCFGDSQKFIIALDDYEKHLKKVEYRINNDIKPYFFKIKLKKNLMVSPAYILELGILFSSLLVPSTILAYAMYLVGMTSFIETISLVNKSIDLNMDNIKKYVTDSKVVEAKKRLDEKLQFVKSLNNKYFPKIKFENEAEKEEIRNLKRVRKELDDQQKQNKFREEDFLDYIKLSEEDKLKLRKKGMSLQNIQKYRTFKPDVPSFMNTTRERDDIKIRNFLEFALDDTNLKDKDIDINVRDINLQKIIEVGNTSLKKESSFINIVNSINSKGGR